MIRGTAGGEGDLCSCAIMSTTSTSWSGKPHVFPPLVTQVGVSCVTRAFVTHDGYTLVTNTVRHGPVEHRPTTSVWLRFPYLALREVDFIAASKGRFVLLEDDATAATVNRGKLTAVWPPTQEPGDEAGDIVVSRIKRQGDDHGQPAETTDATIDKQPHPRSAAPCCEPLAAALKACAISWRSFWYCRLDTCLGEAFPYLLNGRP